MPYLDLDGTGTCRSTRGYAAAKDGVGKERGIVPYF